MVVKHETLNRRTFAVFLEIFLANTRSICKRGTRFDGVMRPSVRLRGNYLLVVEPFRYLEKQTKSAKVCFPYSTTLSHVVFILLRSFLFCCVLHSWHKSYGTKYVTDYRIQKVLHQETGYVN